MQYIKKVKKECTALNCLFFCRAKSIIVIAGAHDLSQTETTTQFIEITENDIFQDPNYDANLLTFDLSVLKLPQPLIFSGTLFF